MDVKIYNQSGQNDGAATYDLREGIPCRAITVEINSFLEDGQSSHFEPTIVAGQDPINLITFEDFNPASIVAEYTIRVSIVPNADAQNFPDHIRNEQYEAKFYLGDPSWGEGNEDWQNAKFYVDSNTEFTVIFPEL